MNSSLNVRIPLLNSLPMVGVDHLLGPLVNGSHGSQHLPSVHHLTTSSSSLTLSDYSNMLTGSPGMPTGGSHQTPSTVQALPTHYLSSGQADLHIRLNPTLVTHPITYHPQQMIGTGGLQPGDYMPNFDYMLNGSSIYATTVSHQMPAPPLTNGTGIGSNSTGSNVSHDVVLMQHQPNNANRASVGPPPTAETAADNDAAIYNSAKIVPYDQW